MASDEAAREPAPFPPLDPVDVAYNAIEGYRDMLEDLRCPEDYARDHVVHKVRDAAAVSEPIKAVFSEHEQLQARVRELEEALRPFADVLADVLPSPEYECDLLDHGFDPDEGVPVDLGPDAPTVADYRRAAEALKSPRQED